MDLVHFILGNFLVFTTLVARCLYVCKDAKEPSGKNWNSLSKICHDLCRNDRFLAIYANVSCHKCTTSDRRWQWSYQLGVCFRKKHLREPVMKEYWSSTLWFRNVDCAYWRNSCIDDRSTLYLQQMIENYDFSQLNMIFFESRHEVLWCW